nr:MAG TPA: hypothetical protein [Caudoviricetes sp.]
MNSTTPSDKQKIPLHWPEGQCRGIFARYRGSQI